VNECDIATMTSTPVDPHEKHCHQWSQVVSAKSPIAIETHIFETILLRYGLNGLAPRAVDTTVVSILLSPYFLQIVLSEKKSAVKNKKVLQNNQQQRVLSTTILVQHI
jgi:hypothetical protein